MISFIRDNTNRLMALAADLFMKVRAAHEVKQPRLR